MINYLKNLCFALGGLIWAISHSVIAAPPTSIDLQKFTCQQFINLFLEEIQQDDDADIAASGDMSLEILVWASGQVIKDDFYSETITFDLIEQSLENCDKKNSSLLLSTMNSTYKSLAIKEYRDRQDITKLTCQNLEKQNGEWTSDSRALLIWMEGHLSKKPFINLAKQSEMINMVFKKCQQQPTSILLPMMQEIVKTR
ncbi:MAG: hypothetical protein JNK86_03065 [Alphaproteobacteria bacterium]|nr:hypothetical protein [Alphaproteobacteria bacterium]